MQINNAQLRERFMRMELIKAKFQSEIGKLSDEQLIYKPSSQSWCIEEVIHHVVAAETEILSYFKKHPPSEARFRLKFKNHLYFFFLRVLMLGPFKLKVPRQAQSIQPESDKSMDELLTTWGVVRNEWIEMLHNLPYDNNASTFRHPAAGFISTPQTLTFIGDHLIHHLKQLKRIKKSQS